MAAMVAILNFRNNFRFRTRSSGHVNLSMCSKFHQNWLIFDRSRVLAANTLNANLNVRVTDNGTDLSHGHFHTTFKSCFRRNLSKLLCVFTRNKGIVFQGVFTFYGIV
jgi:hypothetical protein